MFFCRRAVAGYFGAWRVLSCAGRTVSCAEAVARKCPGRVEGGGLALRPASSSATRLQQGLLDPSAPQTMAGRVEGGGLALRPASSTDAPERAARSVRFHPRPEVIEVESRRRAVAIRRRADFLAVVACAHVDMSEDEQAASAMFAPARGSHKPAMYLLDSSAADTWGQAAGALEARLTADAALQDELNAHETTCWMSAVSRAVWWLSRRLGSVGASSPSSYT